MPTDKGITHNSIEDTIYLPGGHLSILENPSPFIKIVSDIAKGVL